MGQLPKFNTENENPRVLDAEKMDILEPIQEFLNIWIGLTNTLMKAILTQVKTITT